VNVEKTKYVLLSRQQNVGQNLDIRIADIWELRNRRKFDSEGH
jgi:hypothetical protein